MGNSVEVLVTSQVAVDLDLEGWQSRLADLMAHLGLPDETGLSLTFVDDPAIADLNSRYLGKNGPTDVLSFPQHDFSGLQSALPAARELAAHLDGPPVTLGDIVVSIDTAGRQATDFGHPLDREIGFLLVHGLLHLLGEDHQTPDQELQMRGLQRQCLTHLGLSLDGWAP